MDMGSQPEWAGPIRSLGPDRVQVKPSGKIYSFWLMPVIEITVDEITRRRLISGVVGLCASATLGPLYAADPETAHKQEKNEQSSLALGCHLHPIYRLHRAVVRPQ